MIKGFSKFITEAKSIKELSSRDELADGISQLVSDIFGRA